AVLVSLFAPCSENDLIPARHGGAAILFNTVVDSLLIRFSGESFLVGSHSGEKRVAVSRTRARFSLRLGNACDIGQSRGSTGAQGSNRVLRAHGCTLLTVPVLD